MSDPLLSIRDLTVDFSTDDGPVHAVRGVDLDVAAGEVLAVVGESGSGKSVTAMSVLSLLPKPQAKVTGSVRWRGRELLELGDADMREVRGGEIAMIFQDPLTALNPVHTVGDQIMEMVLAHRRVSKKEAKRRAVEMLNLVHIPQPERRVDMYPHEYSGGMRQRAMIAMALSCDPALVIADEPTTALDVTVQAQVLEVLVEATQQKEAAVMLITHDLGVVAGTADRVAVMYAGKVVEQAPSLDLFESPEHPYTLGLLDSIPRLQGDASQPLVPIGGQPPSMLNPPAGCAFHPRCKFARASAGCAETIPPLEVGPKGHPVACLRAADVASATVPDTGADDREGAT
jgi:oligopeptide/dipeptide ABC transporter ATP-binding protein